MLTCSCSCSCIIRLLQIKEQAGCLQTVWLYMTVCAQLDVKKKNYSISTSCWAARSRLQHRDVYKVKKNWSLGKSPSFLQTSAFLWFITGEQMVVDEVLSCKEVQPPTWPQANLWALSTVLNSHHWGTVAPYTPNNSRAAVRHGWITGPCWAPVSLSLKILSKHQWTKCKKMEKKKMAGDIK